jgi:hypothetical protein
MVSFCLGNAGRQRKARSTPPIFPWSAAYHLVLLHPVLPLKAAETTVAA